jgi:hypothetical protein
MQPTHFEADEACTGGTTPPITASPACARLDSSTQQPKATCDRSISNRLFFQVEVPRDHPSPRACHCPWRGMLRGLPWRGTHQRGHSREPSQNSMTAAAGVQPAAVGQCDDGGGGGLITSSKRRGAPRVVLRAHHGALNARSGSADDAWANQPGLAFPARRPYPGGPLCPTICSTGSW